MEINVTNQTENKLFDRKEICFNAVYKGNATPSRETVLEEICKKLSLNPELTVVTNITQAFGNNTSSVTVYSYSKKETMAHIERISGGEPAEKKPAAQQAKTEAKEKEPEAVQTADDKK